MGPHNLLSSAYMIILCMLFLPIMTEWEVKTNHGTNSVFLGKAKPQAINEPFERSNLLPPKLKEEGLFVFRPNSPYAPEHTGGTCGPGGVTTDLYVWLKADKEAYNSGTTDATDGQTVATWNDQSDTNTDASTDGNPPLFRDNSTHNINFNPVLDFDGTNDRLSLGNLANIKSGGSHNGHYTILTVGIREDANTNYTIGAASQSGAQGLRFGYAINTALLLGHGTSASAGRSVSAYDSPAESPFMLYGRYGDNPPSGDRQYMEETRDNNREFGSNTTNSILQGSLTNYVAHHNGDYYNGVISEVIIFDNTISDSDKNKIYSYLALKYGMMLKDLADASEDFLASDGSVIWDVSANSSYHNEVAGIGRDDASELNQKQSKSTDGNSDDIVTIGLGNMALTNSANSNGFTADKSFMIWGNDNGNTNTTSSDVPDGVFARMSRVWKVQETGTVGNVSVQFDLTGLGHGTDIDQFKLLVSGSATMANSTVVAAASSLSGNILTFNDVDISNNQYFSLATSVAAPGGVSTDLYAWLKADGKAYHTGTTQATDGQTVTTWSNQAGHLTNGTESANPPTYRNNSTNNINFNPTLQFDGSNDLLELGNLDQVKSGGANAGDYTLLAVGTRQDNSANYVIGSTGTLNDNELILGYGANTTATLTHWGTDLTQTVKAFDSPQQSPFLVFGDFDGSGRALEETRGGTLTSSTDSHSTDVLGNKTNYIGRHANDYYNGLISEVIVYDNDLSTTDKNKVYSYLALKYGMTLSNAGGGTAGDYIASDGTTTFWDASEYSTYHHDVAGIGRDDTSDLNQKQSKSTRGNMMSMGLGSIAATNTANANSFTADKSFLLWGNDDADSLQSAANSSDTPDFTTERMSRIWRVKKTGTVGNVEIQFDLTGLGYDTDVNDFKLIVSGSTTMASGTLTSSSSINGNVVSFSNVSLSDGDYFTIAVATTLPAAVSSDFYVWLRADQQVYNTGTTDATDGQTVSKWNDQSTTDTDANADGNPPIFQYDINSNLNFNPTVEFDGTNDRLNLGDLAQIKAGATNAGDYTLLVVGIRKDANSNPLIGSADGDPENELLFGYDTDTQLKQGRVINTLDLTVNAYNNPQTGPYLIFGDLDGTNRSIEETRNGTLTTGTDLISTDIGTGLTNYIGYHAPNGPSFYNGNIAEVIVYDNNITTAEKNKIYSYLALKYGLTLSNTGGGTAGDYTAADGTTIFWDASANSSYHYDVAGIGRDAASQLIQKQSKSTSGNIVTMGLGSVADLNSGNSNNFTVDKSFLLWGNDNADSLQSGANSSDLPSQILERMSRVWKVQETGTVGNVEIRFDLTDLGYSNRIEDFALIISGSSTMASGMVTEPSSLSSNVVSFTGVDLTDGQFFTLATKRKAPGGIGTDLTLWLKADQGTNTTTNGSGITSWSDFSGKAHNATGTGDAVYNTNWSNFNPAIDFAGTVDPISGNVTRTNGTASTVFVVAEQTGTNSDNLLDFGTFTQSLTGASYSHNINNFNLTLNQKLIVSASDQGSTSGATVYQNGNLIHTYASKARNTSWTTNSYTIGDNGPGFVANNNSLDGHIAEVIYFDQQLSATNQQKVESYLGIKYGITLDNTAGGTAGDYVDSDGNTLWDASVNSTYHHDVFAIGRDDLSELNQKQSKSANGDAIISIGLGSIAADNASNANSFTANYSFMLVGNDNGATTQAGANTSDVPNDTRERMSRIWKVQETGTVGNVEIRFDLTGLGFGSNLSDFKLITSSSATMASGTLTPATSVNSNVVTFSGVDLTNGQFFTLATKSPAPGGINTDLTLWLKADQGTNTTTNGSGITSWTDNAIANNATGTGDAQYNTNWSNFNPALDFTGTINPISGNVTRTNGTASTVFVVGELTSTGSQMLYNFGSAITQNLANTNYAHNINNFNLTLNQKLIVSASDQGSTSGATVYENGNLIHTYATKFRNTSWTTNPYTIGGGGSFSLNGHMAEVIYFDQQLSATDQQKVESYLGIKYGITLDNTAGGTAGDYVDSGGTTLWDASANSTYHNDVTVMGRDDLSKLNQKQSKSTNSDAIVTMGLGSVAATNSANANSFSADQSFMLWGNDNAATAQASANTADLPANTLERISRVWKVQESGTVGNVEMQFDLTGLGYGTDLGDFHLIISNTSTMASGTLIAASSINGNVVSFTGIDLADGQFFSLATKIEAPGGVTTDLYVWLKADKQAFNTGTTDATDGQTVATWNDQSVTDTDAIADGNPPLYKNNSTDNINFNPTLDFDGTDDRLVLGNLANIKSGAANGGDYTLIAVGRRDDNSPSYIIGSPTRTVSNEELNFGYRNGGVNATIEQGSNLLNLPTAVNSQPFSPFMLYAGYDGSGRTLEETRGDDFRRATDSNTNDISGTRTNYIGDVETIGITGLDGHYRGPISEVIVYDNDITDLSKQQVYSYLALKYGLSLTNNSDNDATSNEVISGSVREGDYVASNGSTVFWTYSANSTYHNDVAGIGRDDDSDLNQKQSKSTNTDAILSIGLGSMAATNSANANSLSADHSFMLWGNDNAATAQASANTADLPANTMERMSRVWKVEETGTVGNVEIQFDLTGLGYSSNLGDFNLIISNTATMASGTLTKASSINGNVVSFTGVDLADGQFFSLATKIEAPGGVTTDLYVWLKADKQAFNTGTTDASDGQTVATWNDQSATDTDATADGNPPLYKNNSTDNINFNPTLDFDGTDDRLVLGNLANIKSGAVNGGDYTLIAVGRRDDNSPSYVIGSPTRTVSNEELNFGYRNGGVNATIEQGSNLLNLPTAVNSQPFSPFMLYAGYDGSGRTLEETRGDDFRRATDSNTNDISGTRTNYIGDVETIGITGLDGHYRGPISEVIIYDNDITDLSKQQVYSYLALKYGLSLTNNSDNDATSNEVISGSVSEGDYVASDGSTVLWTYSANSTYHYDVAGIGRDDDSDLNQKQSKSTNTDAIVTIGLDDDTDGLESTNTANSSTFSTDKSFLLWGNDNADLNSGTAGESDFDPLQVKARLNREWKVQETGTIGTVVVRFDVSGLLGPDENVGTNDESKIVLLVDDDSDFTSGASIVDQSYVTNGDGLVNFRVDFTNGQFFTLASQEKSALAISLLSFEAEAHHDGILLSWTTALEEENSHFRIERSRNGEQFETAGLIPGQGNSSTLLRYQFLDNHPNTGINYYRLIDVDIKGLENTSHLVRVDYNLTPKISPPYPNPVRKGEELIIPTNDHDPAEPPVLYHLSGAIEDVPRTYSANRWYLDTSPLASGIYMVLVKGGGTKGLHKVIVLNH